MAWIIEASKNLKTNSFNVILAPFNNAEEILSHALSLSAAMDFLHLYSALTQLK